MYINERLGSAVIKGIGIDLIELNRIHHSMQQSDRLMQRVLTTYEQTIFQQLKSEQRRVEYLAGRFAAKEAFAKATGQRSEEHTSELQSRGHIVCRLLLDKKNK